MSCQTRRSGPSQVSDLFRSLTALGRKWTLVTFAYSQWNLRNAVILFHCGDDRMKRKLADRHELS